MAVAGRIERDLTAEQLRERLSSELRRYVAPVALPTVGPEESGPGEEAAVRARLPMSADGDDAESERPL
jgi:hypothetical protein